MTKSDADATRWFLQNILPHEPALRAWLRRKHGASHDADDIIQETYTVLASLQNREQIRFPKAYLFRVAHSVLVRNIRQSRVVSIQAAGDLEELDIPDEAASPEETTLQRDELRHLAAAIASMPLQARTAFILRRVHGLSQREIAKKMRISESTVEKHIARGIKFLIEWAAHGGSPDLKTSNKEDGRNTNRHGRAKKQPRY